MNAGVDVLITCCHIDLVPLGCHELVADGAEEGHCNELHESARVAVRLIREDGGVGQED